MFSISNSISKRIVILSGMCVFFFEIENAIVEHLLAICSRCGHCGWHARQPIRMIDHVMWRHTQNRCVPIHCLRAPVAQLVQRSRNSDMLATKRFASLCLPASVSVQRLKARELNSPFDTSHLHVVAAVCVPVSIRKYVKCDPYAGTTSKTYK